MKDLSVQNSFFQNKPKRNLNIFNVIFSDLLSVYKNELSNLVKQE